jgi:hypothetical protein
MSHVLARLRRVAVGTLVIALVTALLFVTIEGVASTVLFVRAAANRTPEGLSSDYVTRYDDRLGWVYIPNGRAEGTFGPGTRVTINGHGFRATFNHTPDVPAGRIRVVCSGDSFTFGTDVSDEHAWCHRLTEIDPRIESMNLGQGGYGIDQAYLRFERDARPFAHQVHVFAFITEDFRRMASNRFGTRGKPTLRVDGDRLVVENVPVPPPIGAGRVVMGVSRAADTLKTVELIGLLRRRISGPPAAATGSQSDEHLRALADRVFLELKRLNEAKGSRVVLVYFPMASDYLNASSDPWREHVRQSARALGVGFVDVVEAFRRMPPADVAPMYIRPWSGHYSPQGNEFVARLLYEEIRSATPRVALPGQR